MSLSDKDKKSFQMLETKLKRVNSEDKITEFIKDNPFSSYLIKTNSSYRCSSIMTMALYYGFEPLIQRLMIEQFSIELTDRIYHPEILMKNFHLYNIFNQNNVIEAFLIYVGNSYSTNHLLNSVKDLFDICNISINDISLNNSVFSLAVEMVATNDPEMKHIFIMDILQHGIKNNLLPQTKKQLRTIKECNLFDYYDSHVKNRILAAELLSGDDKLIFVDKNESFSLENNLTLE